MKCKNDLRTYLIKELLVATTAAVPPASSLHAKLG